MNNRPIGVFDSGVGGLTTVKELHKVLPGEDIVYFGDTGRVPYGTRSRQTIRKYSAQCMHYLLGQGAKALVVACGTVSSNLTDEDVAQLAGTLPYTGVVLPSARAACALSSEGRIGVIATSASIRSGAYGRAIRAIQPSAQVFGAACPLLVPLVENGMLQSGNQITRLTVEMYLEPLMRENIDTLILGCTHFPLLYDIINDILDYKVTLVDSGAAAAQHMKALLLEQDALSGRTEGGSTFYHVTDTVEGFAGVAKYFLQEEVSGNTTVVDLDTLADGTVKLPVKE